MLFSDKQILIKNYHQKPANMFNYDFGQSIDSFWKTFDNNFAKEPFDFSRKTNIIHHKYISTHMEEPQSKDKPKISKPSMSQSTNEPSMDELTLLQPTLQDFIYLQSRFSQQTPQVYVDMDDKLGQGSFSSVRNGYLKTSNTQLQPVVLKVSKENYHEWAKRYREDYQVQVQSLVLLKECPYVVKIYGAFYEKVKNSKRLWIIQQKCKGSLDDQKKDIIKNPRMVFQIFQQLLYYLDYAHNLTYSQEQVFNQNKKETDNLKIDIMSPQFYKSIQKLKNCCRTIIHKDLKPANILIRSKNAHKIEIAVADFGMAMLSGSIQQLRQESFGGSANYFGPQMMKKRPFDARTDCWCFGVIMYDFLCGERINKGRMKIMERIQATKQFSRFGKSALKSLPITERMKNVLQNCIRFKFEDRQHSRQLKQLWEKSETRNKVEKRRQMFSEIGQHIVKELVSFQLLLNTQLIQQRSKIKIMLLEKLENQLKGIVISLLNDFFWLFKKQQLENICDAFDLDEYTFTVPLSDADVNSFFELQPYPQLKITFKEIVITKFIQIFARDHSCQPQLRDRLNYISQLLSISRVKY